MTQASCLDLDEMERPTAPFSFFSVSDSAVARELRPNLGDIVRSIKTEIRSLIHLLLVCPSAETFRMERAKVFGKYLLFAKVLSKITLTDTDSLVHQQLVQGALAAQERQLREKGGDLFGGEATAEAIFSLVTMRRAYRLIPQILARDTERKDEDRNTAKQFGVSAVWASLHLDVLMASVSDGKTLPLDVLTEILQGLRSAITAYACAREGYNLRYPPTEPGLFPVVEWDEEDKALAESSTGEREATIPDGY